LRELSTLNASSCDDLRRDKKKWSEKERSWVRRKRELGAKLTLWSVILMDFIEISKFPNPWSGFSVF